MQKSANGVKMALKGAKMANVMDTLRARGFVKQTVYEEDLYKLLDSA